MISRTGRADLANPAQDHFALAVLGRFLGVGPVEMAYRLLEAAEVLADVRLGHVERAHARVRKYAAPLLEDRVLAPDIAAIAGAIRSGEFDSEEDIL